MTRAEQVADYIRRYRATHSLDSLREVLRQQKVADPDIEEGIKLAQTQAASETATALFLKDGLAHWQARVANVAEVRGVKRELDFRLCFMPEGAVVCWVLRLFTQPHQLQVCQLGDPSVPESKACLETAAKTGKLVVHLQGPKADGAISVKVEFDGPALERALKQAASYNGGVSRLSGPAAASRFVEIFAPAFQTGGFDAAWEEVERSAVRADPQSGEGEAASQPPAMLEDQMSSNFQRREAAAPRGGGSAGEEELEEILGALGADLYASNAFRAAEVSVNAAAGELRKRQQLAEMSAKTGADVPPGSSRALAKVPAASPEELRDAIERISDPWRRLVEEFFWFWPPPSGQEKKDEAWAALLKGEAQKAAELWEKRGAGEGVVRHNLGVFHHASALDLEASGKDPERRDFHWGKAMASWKAVAAGADVWEALTARIKRLDDRRVGAAAAQTLRRLLARAILATSAGLAAKAAERRDTPSVRRHLGLMREFGADAAALEAVMATAAKPVRERIQALCAASKGEMNADARKGSQVGRKLLTQAEPLLAVMDGLFPEGGAARDSAHDAVAELANRAITEWSNLKENQSNEQREREYFDLSLTILELCAGKTISNQVEKNIAASQSVFKSIQAAALYSLCWFCKKNPMAKEKNVVIPLHMITEKTYDAQRKGYMTKYKTAEYKVPCCYACGAYGVGVSRRNYALEFPDLAKLIGEGWQLGKEPA